MAIKKIPIDQVKIGMFIEDMDIPWVDSPFLRHKKKLKTEKDIALLKKAGVKIATINFAKSDVEPPTEEPKASEPPISNDKPSLTVTPPDTKQLGPKEEPVIKKEPETKKESTPEQKFKESYGAAVKLQNQAVEMLDKVAADIQNGDKINSEALTPIVKDSLSLIDADNQALIALLQNQRRSKQIQAHSFSVMSLALGLADTLNVTEPNKIALATAGLLHESGWTRLPLNLFLKGKNYVGKEKILADQHIPIIAKILKSSEGFDPLIIKVTIQHHRKFTHIDKFEANTEDGLAQMLAICNLYDAMIHGIGEHTAQLSANAVRTLLSLSKKKEFPMNLVTAFIRLVGVYPINSAIRLTDERKGIVINANRTNPMNPRIKLYYDESGKLLNEPLEIQLADDNLTIAEVINPKINANDPANVLNLDTA